MAVMEDEFDDITPATKKVAAKATKPATTTLEEDEPEITKTSTPKAVEVEDIATDFDDEKIAAKGDGLDRIRPEKGKAKRFAFLPFIKLMAGKNHFVDGKGKFRCLTPNEANTREYCCEKLDKDGGMFIEGLAIEYTNADSKTGRYEKGTPVEWEIGYVEMSRSNFRSVKKLVEEDQNIYDLDLVISHDDSRAFGYAFNKVASKARWKSNPELAKEVEAAAQKFIKDGGKKLIGKLGKKINLTEWKALFSGQAEGAEDASLDDISAID